MHAPDSDRVENLIKKMTLNEKVKFFTGIGNRHLDPEKGKENPIENYWTGIM